MAGIDDEQTFYLVVLLIALPLIIFAFRFGLFMTMPKFILRLFFMQDYNKERKRIDKRRKREEKKRRN